MLNFFDGLPWFRKRKKRKAAKKAAPSRAAPRKKLAKRPAKKASKKPSKNASRKATAKRGSQGATKAKLGRALELPRSVWERLTVAELKRRLQADEADRFEAKTGWTLYDPASGEFLPRRATKAERDRQLRNPDGYIRVPDHPTKVLVI